MLEKLDKRQAISPVLRWVGMLYEIFQSRIQIVNIICTYYTRTFILELWPSHLISCRLWNVCRQILCVSVTFNPLKWSEFPFNTFYTTRSEDHILLWKSYFIAGEKKFRLDYTIAVYVWVYLCVIYSFKRFRYMSRRCLI